MEQPRETEPPYRFAVTYDEAEVWQFRRLSGLRRDRGPSSSGFWLAMVGFIFGIGFAALFAFKAGWVPFAAFKPVLFTAYAAFAAGAVAYHAAARLRSRQIGRREFAATRGEAWEFVFAPDGVRCVCGPNDLRLRWDGVNAVESAAGAVAFWCDGWSGFFLPRRLFADTEAFERFAAWAGACAAAARTLAS